MLEFRGGWFISQYRLHAMDVTPRHKSEGPLLAMLMGRERERFVLPKGYQHFEITRFHTRGNSMGGGPWYLRTVSLDELTQLGGTTEGKHGDLLRYNGPRADLSFEWNRGESTGTLSFQPLTGGSEKVLTEPGAMRGVVTLPGAGLLKVETYGRWQLNLTRQDSKGPSGP
ncbi:hypothetical protein ACFQVC_23455 [Streptomyces monticola]|uniref:Lipocalin-like domain-containing protein n=1 Tax=Streptomyces monticola TaxID=2666263 RepID=A0ABW2JNZ1_9ACTN